MTKIRQQIFKKADLLGFLLISVLCCLPGHCAESIAGQTFVTNQPVASIVNLGDINGDGDITSVDAAMVLQMVNGLITPTPDQISAADADQDGKVTANDAQMILYWATQGLGVNPPQIFMDIAELPVLDSTSGSIGSTGGNISLSSGATLIVPEQTLQDNIQVTLSKQEPEKINFLGNQRCYQIDPDISYLPGAKIQIPYSDLLKRGTMASDIEGVELFYYSPWTRRYEVLKADFTPGSTGLTIDLDQVRKGSGGTGDAYQNNTSNGLEYSIRLPDSSTPPLNQGTPLRVVVSENTLYYVPPVNQGGIPLTKILEVPYYEQGGEKGYCWAACTTMVLNYVVSSNPVKPWELIGELNVDPASGLSEAQFFGDKYADSIKTRTGVAPKVQNWWSSDGLRDYLVNQIVTHDQPGLLFLTQKDHMWVVVGYSIENGKYYFYAHDPRWDPADDPNRRDYGRIAWEDVEKSWHIYSGYYTLHIPKNAAVPGRKVTVCPLSRDPGSTLSFISPVEKTFEVAGSRNQVHFAWYDETTTEPGFISSNGDGIPLAAIPNYYSMTLGLRLKNVSSQPITVQVSWDFPELGALYGGDQVVIVPAPQMVNGQVAQGAGQEITVKFNYPQNFKELGEEQYTLRVKVVGVQDNIEYDSFTIPIRFDNGIRLEASIVPDEGNPPQNVVKVTWSDYLKEVGTAVWPGNWEGMYYVVFRSEDGGKSWKTYKQLMRGEIQYDEKGQVVFKDTDPKQNLFYYILTRLSNKEFVITSDIVEPKKGEEGDVTIPDPCLGKVLNLHLNNLYQEKNKFWKSDLEKLEAISWSWINDTETCKINNLSGLEYCINLKNIYFSRHNFTDLSPLENLLKLEKLFVLHTPVSDINPLTDLINLTYLNLGANEISDISPIKGLINLNRLLLTENHITDITPIVENPGIGAHDEVFLKCNLLDCKGDITSSKNWENIYTTKKSRSWGGLGLRGVDYELRLGFPRGREF